MKNQYQILLLLAFICITYTLTTHHADKFEQWQSKFKIKTKDDKDFQYRKILFSKKVDQIDKHNAKPVKSYKKGLNKFSHLTKEQFVKTYLGHKKIDSKGLSVFNDHKTDKTTKSKPKAAHLQSGPGMVNWTQLGYTTEVKDQGQCGSCWAFSTTGALEGISAQYGDLQSFSEQQILDCSSNEYWGNGGCNGGSEQIGLAYASVHGIHTEDEYSYTAVQGDCYSEQGNFQISSFVMVQDCDSIDQVILQNPIAVAVMANYWQDYQSGILDECASDQINHAVLLTGRTQDAYIIKNSWSTQWGEFGYIRVALGNCCGMCQTGVNPIY